MRLKFPDPKKYPKRVFFKEESYRVIFVRGLPDLGDTDPVKRLIRIRSGMSRKETFSTFIHELFHLLEFETPINISHKAIHQLEQGLITLIIDNLF